MWLWIILGLLLILFLIILFYIDGYRYYWINDADVYALDRKYQNKTKIKNCVISLTSTPDRLLEIKPTIMSLLNSSRAVDAIEINVPRYSTKGQKYHVPKWLKSLKSVKVYRVEKDLGPATKLLPTLRRAPNPKQKIIVVDDDVIYGYYTIENILNCYSKYNRGKRKVAITIYGDKIGKDDRMDYSWTTRIGNYCWGETWTDVLRGHSGYLVTPDMFSQSIYHYKGAPKEAFFVDDNYFSWHLRRNRVKILMLGLHYQSVPLPSLNNCFIDGLHAQYNGNGENERKVNRHYRKKYE